MKGSKKRWRFPQKKRNSFANLTNPGSSEKTSKFTQPSSSSSSSSSSIPSAFNGDAQTPKEPQLKKLNCTRKVAEIKAGNHGGHFRKKTHATTCAESEKEITADQEETAETADNKADNKADNEADNEADNDETADKEEKEKTADKKEKEEKAVPVHQAPTSAPTSTPTSTPTSAPASTPTPESKDSVTGGVCKVLSNLQKILNEHFVDECVLIPGCPQPESARKNCAKDRMKQLQIPSISIQDYLGRILKYLYVPCHEKLAFVATIMIYVDRYMVKNEYSRICLASLHMSLFVAAMVAYKFVFDTPQFKLQYFSKVSGFPLIDLQTAEIDFLQALGFDLYVFDNEMQSYLTEFAHIQKH